MEKDAINAVLNILEVETASDSEHREQLAVVIASGKAKETSGVSPTQDQVKKLSEKDVEKCFKRYEASLPSKTCDAMVLHFSSSHEKHCLIFSLLMKETF